MHTIAVKTRLSRPGDRVESIIKESIHTLPERSVVVIASKLFSYEENRLVSRTTNEKSEKWNIARREADLWLDPNESKFQCMLTVKGNWMFANAGVDESNAVDNSYVLWPKDPQLSINRIWEFLRNEYGVKEVGVIMSDSRAMPLTWGVMGHAIAACGFEPLKSYIGKPDLFGRVMQMEQVSVSQSLVAAGTFVMGEGAEQTPMAIISDIPHIVFLDRVPSEEELKYIHIDIEDDIFAPLLTKVPWQKGDGGKGE